LSDRIKNMEMPTGITLDLSAHCVETEIRRQYNHRISLYFKALSSDNKTDLETEIELLVEALENFDFKGLRSGYPALAGGVCDDIRLIRETGGRIQIQHNGKIIDADYYF
jgi:hypothetical protein